MKTKSAATEIMYQLSCSNKIDDAVAEYTVSEGTTAFAVVPLANQSEEDMTAALSHTRIDPSSWDREAALDEVKLASVRAAVRVPSDVPHTYDSVLKYVLTRASCKNHV
jgi:Kinase binding protein CGI-121